MMGSNPATAETRKNLSKIIRFPVRDSRYKLRHPHKHAGGSKASIQFLVNGQWTTPERLSDAWPKGWNGGDILKKEFETLAWPSQLRLINDATDAFGYKRIVVFDPSGQEHVVVDSTNGARYGNNQFWIDGDEIKVSQRDFHVPSRKDEL